MSEKAICALCGEPMPEGEEMFKYHGYSGPCPKPPHARIREPSPSSPGEPATRWHITEPFKNEHDTDCWQVEIQSADGDTIIADLYGPSPEVCLERARSFVQAQQGWRQITDNDVGKAMLVTNNLLAKNARGDMSHRWITWIQKSAGYDGPYMGFDAADRRLCNLTHCAPLPSPPLASHPSAEAEEAGL